MSSPWFSERAKPKPTARNIRVSVTIRVNTKLTAHMSNLKRTPQLGKRQLRSHQLQKAAAGPLTFSDDSHQWNKRVWQCGIPARTHTGEREAPNRDDSCCSRNKADGLWQTPELFYLWMLMPSQEARVSVHIFMSWKLTLINRMRRCAADRERCTAADG